LEKSHDFLPVRCKQAHGNLKQEIRAASGESVPVRFTPPADLPGAHTIFVYRQFQPNIENLETGA
jgi:hypothetical protein